MYDLDEEEEEEAAAAIAAMKSACHEKQTNGFRGKTTFGHRATWGYLQASPAAQARWCSCSRRAEEKLGIVTARARDLGQGHIHCASYGEWHNASKRAETPNDFYQETFITNLLPKLLHIEAGSLG